MTILFYQYLTIFTIKFLEKFNNYWLCIPCLKDEDIDILDVNAYAVVYASDDRESYEFASSLLAELNQNRELGTVIALVENKSDLVRTRVVSKAGLFD